MKCPRCNEPCERPTVDVGVGEVAVGPWACDACYWVEGATAEEQAYLVVEDHAFEECKESAYHCTLTLLHPPHTGAYCHRMIPGTLRPEVEMPCGKPRCAHAPAPTLPLIESKE